MNIVLSGSVGHGGDNRSEDVETVQTALNAAARLTLDDRLDPGPVDGMCGVGTEGAIARLQRRIGIGAPDARVDPGGRTLLRLNSLLAIGDVLMSFPFAKSSATPYHGSGAGMRAFGAWRSGGARAHAGVDLYFPDFTTVLALADGTVTRGPYPFYCKTFAVEIDHGPFLARYGEIAPEDTWPVRKGDHVQRGDPVGRVGILKKANGKRLGVPSMMLHLEMYDKTETGALTRAKGTSARHVNGAPFLRRRDIVDPTGFLARAPLP